MKGKNLLIISVLAAVMVTAGLLVAFPVPATAAGPEDAQAIVDKARVTFDGFMKDEHYTWLHDNLGKAKGVVIFPQVLKAGFILGGSGGTGVFVLRDEKTCNWSEPALAGCSIRCWT